MAKAENETCGNSHLKLAGMIVGVVLAVCGGTLAVVQRIATAQEPRVRTLEEQSIRSDERMKAVQKTCEEILNKIDPDHRP